MISSLPAERALELTTGELRWFASKIRSLADQSTVRSEGSSAPAGAWNRAEHFAHLLLIQVSLAEAMDRALLEQRSVLPWFANLWGRMLCAAMLREQGMQAAPALDPWTAANHGISLPDQPAEQLAQICIDLANWLESHCAQLSPEQIKKLGVRSHLSPLRLSVLHVWEYLLRHSHRHLERIAEIPAQRS
jgi:hypothetical protein